jgi:predicted Zn-ribbon and HTH transcriptional regulator
MAGEKPVQRSHCLNCGFEADPDEWDAVEVPSLGNMTRCPECGSTNVMTGQ